MTSENGFGRSDLQRLNEIANQTCEDLCEIPKAQQELECLIHPLSESADKLSFVTWQMLDADNHEVVSKGDEE